MNNEKQLERVILEGGLCDGRIIEKMDVNNHIYIGLTTEEFCLDHVNDMRTLQGQNEDFYAVIYVRVSARVFKWQKTIPSAHLIEFITNFEK
jgi:hypothetical protein